MALRTPLSRPALLAAAAALAFAACSSADRPTTEPAEPAVESVESATAQPRFRYPAAPTAPAADEPTAPGATDAIATITRFLPTAELDITAVEALGATGDARHAWYVSDLLRFFQGAEAELLVDVFEQLTAVSIDPDPDRARSPWLSVTNHLIAWDTPAYPDYREDKAALFTQVEPGWQPFFADADADIDWRLLSWGGVRMDDRPLGDTGRCPGGCIPALDDPATTDAAGGSWYPDERIVFGVVEGDEALAIPQHIAEIHEMFNFTLGGRRFGLPYCTLCGSAQAYRTDDSGAAEQPVLRTSGLLTRSNKVMYDLVTRSVFDTFTGAAVSGPLHDAGIRLEEVTVVRSTWGQWKAAHPATRIIAEDGGIGRSYDLDPLGGRDANGPIFPIGTADDRLGVQELVVGVLTADGTPVAFPSAAASEIIDAGGVVELDGVRLEAVGDGLRAVDAATGDELAAHEAFWFAWSQFHPDTALFAP